MIRVGLVGMVHLAPLPGRPNHDGRSLSDVVHDAVADAETLAAAGFDSVLVQNTLDRPTRQTVDAATIAQLTRVCTEIRRTCALPLGVNLHRNDGPGAVAVAAAVEAEFVRVKVLTGVVQGAEGLIHGCAEETLRLRARLGADIAIWADVHDPISRPLAGETLTEAATDAVHFGMADALVLTRPVLADTLDAIASLRPLLPNVPLIVGGKTTPDTIAHAYDTADGAIVGNALKRGDGVSGAVDPELAAAVVAAARG